MRMFFALTLLPAVVMAGQPIFTLVSGYLARTAVVQMSYRFIVDGQKPMSHAVQIVLHRQDNRCWQGHHLITTVGDSLLHIFSGPSP